MKNTDLNKLRKVLLKINKDLSKTILETDIDKSYSDEFENEFRKGFSSGLRISRDKIDLLLFKLDRLENIVNQKKQ